MISKYTTILRMQTEFRFVRLYLSLLRIILVWIPSVIPVDAQDDIHESIAVSARPWRDSITLRWAPKDYYTWRLANEKGYCIERYTITCAKGMLLSAQKSVLFDTLKPWPFDQWESLLERDAYAPIAAQALYGETFEIDLNESDFTSIIDKVKENEQRYAFALFSADMSPTVATASGMRFTDRTTDLGCKYLYRIIINDTSRVLGSVYTSPGTDYLLPKPEGLSAQFGDKAVMLKWNRFRVPVYTAFELQRSLDGESFEPVSATPMTTLESENSEQLHEYASDSLRDNSRVYYYRVVGITQFGEKGPPSNVISGRGVATPEREPYIVSAVSTDNQTITIRWDFPETSNEAIKGFFIERSPTPSDGYLKINMELISPTTREYTDKSPGHVNYYRVQARGIDDQLLASHPYFAQLIDSIPPSVPRGLQGTVSDSGHVTLRWIPNTETDIYGYRVFRSWTLSEEPSQVTTAPVREARFIDTIQLNTLNRAIYYHVMAVDDNQNRSILSEGLTVTLPDKVRPQPPTLLPAKLEAFGVSLQWLPGSSDDIVSYRIYRRPNTDHKWSLIGIVHASENSVYTFHDKTCKPGQQAQYMVTSVDTANLESDDTLAIECVCITRDMAPAVEWNRYRIARDENTITLTWDYATSDLASFSIYKSTNNSSPELLKVVNGSVRKTEDTLFPQRSYRYWIIASFVGGRRSDMSKELRIDY